MSVWDFKFGDNRIIELFSIHLKRCNINKCIIIFLIKTFSAKIFLWLQ